MNGDLRDMCPPPGSIHRGRSGSASALRAAGDTPTATCLSVYVHVCVCVSVYVSAFLGDDKRSWLPQDHVVTTGTTTTATTAAAAAAAAGPFRPAVPQSETALK